MKGEHCWSSETDWWVGWNIRLVSDRCEHLSHVHCTSWTVRRFHFTYVYFLHLQLFKPLSSFLCRAESGAAWDSMPYRHFLVGLKPYCHFFSKKYHPTGPLASFSLFTIDCILLWYSLNDANVLYSVIKTASVVDCSLSSFQMAQAIPGPYLRGFRGSIPSPKL